MVLYIGPSCRRGPQPAPVLAHDVGPFPGRGPRPALALRARGDAAPPLARQQRAPSERGERRERRPTGAAGVARRPGRGGGVLPTGAERLHGARGLSGARAEGRWATG